MAATQKLYPRGTVKRIVKAHSNRSVSKNADILSMIPPIPLRRVPVRSQCLDYTIPDSNYNPPPIATMLIPDFIRLMREASIRSRKSGEKNISANAVRKVTEGEANAKIFLLL
ncbi:hypothetical protein N7533_004918 [Penicillium manginii]|uniref:uncharacterized protein n=1 Tax=Penicillium manginii TaxID=203109 RepID=UPI002547C22D|nr:uncharacterized protein N7533_004918 [Penicillium manginii]KAJ5755375.1 hypothetical protein N7533_004918 [Penicillium manginii]